MTTTAGKVLIAIFLGSSAAAYVGLLGGAIGRLSAEAAVYTTFGAVIAAALAGIGLVAIPSAFMQARQQ